MKLINKDGCYIKSEDLDIKINLLDDFLFSKIFGEKGCEKELLYLINTFTGRNFEHINFEINELKGEYKGSKKSIVDVLVTTDDGTIVNVESQIKKQKDFHKRSRYYNAKIHSIFLKVSEDYKNLPRVILINILNFNLHTREEYHKIFAMQNIDHEEDKLDIEEIHYIELPKFRKLVKKDNINLDDPKIRLMLLLDKKTPKILIDKVIEMDKAANDMYKKVNQILMSQQEQLTYIRVQKAEHDRIATMEYAKEEAKKEGLAEGLKEGLEKGLEKGLDKAKIEIAKNMKSEGLDVENIKKFTGLSEEKINKL